MRFLLALPLLALTACADPADAPDDSAAAEVSEEAVAPPADPALAPEAAPLAVADAYARAAPAGGVSAVFFDVRNATDGADTLVAARTEAAGRVEIHQTRETDAGLSEMVEVEGGLAVGPGETVRLEPGGLHVMLLDLQRDLVEGDTLGLEVEFAGQGTVTIQAPIRGVGPGE